MKRLIVASAFPASLVLFLMCAGCDPLSAAFTGAEVGVKVFSGAQAKIHVLQGMSAGQIEPYQAVELGEATTDVEPICTFAEISEVQRALRKQTGESKFRHEFPGGEPKLVMNVVLRFCKQGSVFGKEPRLDLLVTFVDGTSGRGVGRVYVEGISQSPLQTKVANLAKADAEAICNLLRERKQGKR